MLAGTRHFRKQLELFDPSLFAKNPVTMSSLYSQILKLHTVLTCVAELEQAHVLCNALLRFYNCLLFEFRNHEFFLQFCFCDSSYHPASSMKHRDHNS